MSLSFFCAGTLSPLAATPALAFIPHETKKVLERMSHMPDVNIVIISGRDVDDLRQKVTDVASWQIEPNTTFFIFSLLATATMAQSVKHPELRSIKEVQQNQHELDSWSQHRH